MNIDIKTYGKDQFFSVYVVMFMKICCYFVVIPGCSQCKHNALLKSFCLCR